MKHLSFIILLFSTLFSKGQSITADPALGQISVVNFSNTSVDANLIALGDIVQLKVPILNNNATNAIPAGTCKLKIGLGSRMDVDPAFNLLATNTSAYFLWTTENQGGQVMLIGDLIAPIPANFSTSALFSVKGILLGSSTITANFLITNHNTTVNLSDENGTNNTSFLPYSIIQPIPVTFTSIVANNEDCDKVSVKFSSENEVNVDRYEIEASKDGVHFSKRGQLVASNSINYSYSFNRSNEFHNSALVIRVKSIDRDGKFQYTNNVLLRKPNCNNNTFNIYPNPVSDNDKVITISSAKNIFNGNLIISLFDIEGKKINTTNLYLLNANQFNFNIGSLAAGHYLLKIYQASNTEPLVFRFLKN